MSDAVVEIIEGQGSPSAKLAAILMHLGINDRDEIASKLGRSPSSMGRIMAEAKRIVCAKSQNCTSQNGENAHAKLQNCTSKPSRTRAQKESPIGDSYTSNVISFYDPDAKRCWIEKETDKLRLCDELYNYWSDKFGSAEFLDLALIQAKPYIQPKSGRPLETQVSAQLARNLQNKLQGDKRYSDACKANGRNQPKASADEWSKVLSEMGAQ